MRTLMSATLALTLLAAGCDGCSDDKKPEAAAAPAPSPTPEPVAQPTPPPAAPDAAQAMTVQEAIDKGNEQRIEKENPLKKFEPRPVFLNGKQVIARPPKHFLRIKRSDLRGEQPAAPAADPAPAPAATP